jgi:hypothetical protein
MPVSSPGGNSFDDPLLWDSAAGGFIASGPTSWERCDWIRVIIYQPAHDAAASAEGKPKPGADNKGNRNWKLEGKLSTIQGFNDLENGDAYAGGIAIAIGQTQKVVDAWESGDTQGKKKKKKTLTLKGKP